MNQRSAISHINKNGVLLVFPINNAKDPQSLWSEFFPRTKMRWEWDDEGDNKVAGMWMLMKRLSNCDQVVYSKWYRGRATFFSRELFTAMLCIYKSTGELTYGLSRTARELLDALESDSPLSTKELKKITELQGRLNEPQYSRAMKELFSRLLIVAYGEVDDGAFPSLAVGATELLFEKLWLQSSDMSDKDAMKIINQYMPEKSKFRNFLEKTILNRPTDKADRLTTTK